MSKRDTKRTEFREKINENPILFFASRFIFTAVLGLVILLVFSVLNYTREDPNQSAVLFSIVALYLTSLIGGVSVSSSPLPFYLSGLIGGTLWLLLLTTVSLFMPAAASMRNSTFLSVFLHLLIVIVFVLGSFIGQLIISAGHSRRRRRKHP